MCSQRSKALALSITDTFVPEKHHIFSHHLQGRLAIQFLSSDPPKHLGEIARLFAVTCVRNWNNNTVQEAQASSYFSREANSFRFLSIILPQSLTSGTPSLLPQPRTHSPLNASANSALPPGRGRVPSQEA